MNSFSPYMDILPPPQRRLWPELDLDRIVPEIPFLADASVIQRDKNTLMERPSILKSRSRPCRILAKETCIGCQ